VPNDLALATALSALSPSAQREKGIASTHGADLLLGGHDHLYFVSKGADAWANFDLAAPVLGAEADDGSTLVIKSGTDFRDLSAFALTLADTPPGSVRRKVIARIEGQHLETAPAGAKSARVQELLKGVLGSVGKTLGAPVCKSTVALDVRSQFIRTAESAAANWFADIVRHAYDGALRAPVDCVFICAGMLRGDSIYGPGPLPPSFPLYVVADGWQGTSRSATSSRSCRSRTRSSSSPSTGRQSGPRSRPR
jgi:5'-nucleotidase